MSDLVLSTFTHEYIPKQEAHIKGVQHFAFYVMLYDQYGKVLLQQRAFSKYYSGGLWCNACCGHPVRVDDITSISEEAENHLQEEKEVITSLTYKSTYRYNFHCSDLIENEVDSIFEGICSNETIKPNIDETNDYKWLSMDEYRQGIHKNLGRYTECFKYIVDNIYF